MLRFAVYPSCDELIRRLFLSVAVEARIFRCRASEISPSEISPQAVRETRRSKFYPYSSAMTSTPLSSGRPNRSELGVSEIVNSSSMPIW